MGGPGKLESRAVQAGLGLDGEAFLGTFDCFLTLFCLGLLYYLSDHSDTGTTSCISVSLVMAGIGMLDLVVR